jgi:hypothetical protein
MFFCEIVAANMIECDLEGGTGTDERKESKRMRKWIGCGWHDCG